MKYFVYTVGNSSNEIVQILDSIECTDNVKIEDILEVVKKKISHFGLIYYAHPCTRDLYRASKKESHLTLFRDWTFNKKGVGVLKKRLKISDFKRGTIVRSKVTGQTYVVDANYGDRATVSTTADITNPEEWEVVS